MNDIDFARVSERQREYKAFEAELNILNTTHE
jgi:hypothetical protein